MNGSGFSRLNAHPYVRQRAYGCKPEFGFAQTYSDRIQKLLRVLNGVDPSYVTTRDCGMNTDDVELCRIYGQMSREYFGERTWSECEAQLREGWLRLRRDPEVTWEEAAPLVKTFWNLASVESVLT